MPLISHGFGLSEFFSFTMGKLAQKIQVLIKLLKIVLTFSSKKTFSQLS